MMAVNNVTVVGGVYRERCMHPRWDRFVGSGGRAASALAAMDVPVELYTYLDKQADGIFSGDAALLGIDLHTTSVDTTPSFEYVHGLSVPVIRGSEQECPPIIVNAANVLRFGMIEGDAIVSAERAVYDPQNAVNPQSFSANGSSARELALVLNRHEAQLFLGRQESNDEVMARELAEQEGAAIVVIKRGPHGALIYETEPNKISMVPAYKSRRVWKIGSGDNFAAHFACAWLHDKLSAPEAATQASLATAYYCDFGGNFPSRNALNLLNYSPICVKEGWESAERPSVYLAGPFFNLQQLWLIEQARSSLMGMGLAVFSPYHDVGRGSAEDVVDKDLQGIQETSLVLALVDGLDSGTIYEIGYARAINHPVIVYSESESQENLKMMEGSGCVIVDDFVSAIYHTVWEAVCD